MVPANNISANLTSARLHSSESVAYIFQDHRLTFGALWHRARAAAAALYESGFRPRQKILFIHDDDLEWPVMFHAMVMIGCVPVVVNPRMSQSDISNVLTRVDCSHALIDSYFNKEINIESCVKIDQLQYESMSRFKDIYNYTDTDELLILTSSGTTGNPKLIVHLHKNLQESFESSNPYLINEHSVILCPAKMSFMFGMIVNLIGTLVTGATTVILKTPHDFKRIFEIINKHKVTHLFAVPSLLKFLLKYKNKKLGTHVKHVYTASEPLPNVVRELFKKRFNLDLLDVYGASETFRWTLTINTVVNNRPGSIGKITPDIEYQILNEHGTECQPGEVGELIVKHSTISSGYYNDPDKTARAFNNGWYRTKDLVYQDNDGYLFYIGRLDSCVKINNQFVSSVQIEREINSIPGIVDSVVVFDRNLDGTDLIVFVVTEDNVLDTHVIKNKLDNGNRYNMPKAVFQIDDIPLTVTNKKIRSLEILKSVAKL